MFLSVDEMPSKIQYKSNAKAWMFYWHLSNSSLCIFFLTERIHFYYTYIRRKISSVRIFSSIITFTRCKWSICFLTASPVCAESFVGVLTSFFREDSSQYHLFHTVRSLLIFFLFYFFSPKCQGLRYRNKPAVFTFLVSFVMLLDLI